MGILLAYIYHCSRSTTPWFLMDWLKKNKDKSNNNHISLVRKAFSIIWLEQKEQFTIHYSCSVYKTIPWIRNWIKVAGQPVGKSLLLPLYSPAHESSANLWHIFMQKIFHTPLLSIIYDFFGIISPLFSSWFNIKAKLIFLWSSELFQQD